MRRRLILLILIPLLVILGLTALVVGVLRAANISDVTLLESVIGSSPTAQALVTYFPLVRFPLQLVFVVVVFGLAWLVSRVSDRLAGRLLNMAGYDTNRPAADDPPAMDSDLATLVTRRRETVLQLASGFISFIAFTVALLMAAGQFFSLTNMALVVTVAINAFGFAARDYIGDMLNGISNIFENRFNIGDNVQIFRVGDKLEGIIEHITVRTLSIRTRTGELINVPQGEVRTLLNYTRGSYSGVDVIVKVAAADLPEAMAELLMLAQDAPDLLPDCIEPWSVIARDGTLGSAADIRIHAKARYGYGAGLRLRIMMLAEERLAAAGISPA